MCYYPPPTLSTYWKYIHEYYWYQKCLGSECKNVLPTLSTYLDIKWWNLRFVSYKKMGSSIGPTKYIKVKLGYL